MLSLNNVSITRVCNMMLKTKKKKWCTFYLCLYHDASLLPQLRDDVSDIDVKATWLSVDCDVQSNVSTSTSYSSTE